MPNFVGVVTGTDVKAGLTAEAWFAGAELLGYDPKARAIVRPPGAAFNVFLRREGNLADAVSFLPGFPDGSFGWAKVLPERMTIPLLFFTQEDANLEDIDRYYDGPRHTSWVQTF